MSEYKDMSVADALKLMAPAVGDLFYASLEYQFEDNYRLAHNNAQMFHALAALFRHHNTPLPEPFASTPLRELAKTYLKELREQTVDLIIDPSEMDEGDDETAPSDEGPWLV